METQVNKKQLIDELTIAKKLAGKKSNLAVIQNAIITLKHDSVIIQSTDLENYRLGVVGENPYRLYDVPCSFPKILVPVDAFMKALKAIPKKQNHVSLALTGNQEFPLCINGKINLIASGHTIEDFPDLPKFPHTGFIDHHGSNHRGYKVFDQTTLNNVLSCGGIPASDERRTHINGLYLDFEHDKIVGTDGNRLHISNMLMNHNGNGPLYDVNPLISRQFIKLLLCPQLRNNIGNATITDKYIFVETGSNGFVCSRLLEGDFPDYTNLFPGYQFQNVLSVEDKKYFADIMGEAIAITNQDYRAVTFSMGENLIVNAVNPEIGEYNNIVDDKDMVEYLGQDLSLSFNPVMIMDAIDCIQDKGVNMYFNSEEHPVWIQSNDQTFNAYIMPIRT